jgi:hypothetical protein
MGSVADLAVGVGPQPPVPAAAPATDRPKIASPACPTHTGVDPVEPSGRVKPMLISCTSARCWRSRIEAPDPPPANKFARPADAPRICAHCLMLCDEILSEALGVYSGPRNPDRTAPELPALGTPQGGVFLACHVHAHAGALGAGWQ